jgi:hypothetical protein
MGFALNRLGWTSRQFMDATNHEIFAAYEDWVAVNCVKEE